MRRILAVLIRRLFSCHLWLAHRSLRVSPLSSSQVCRELLAVQSSCVFKITLALGKSLAANLTEPIFEVSGKSIHGLADPSLA